MTRYYITRGTKAEAWQSFPAFFHGIPACGYYSQRPAAERHAQRIANERGHCVHLTVVTPTEIRSEAPIQPKGAR